MAQFALDLTFGSDDQSAGQTPWLWHGLLAPGKLTLLTSLWKSGKTTLLAHLLARRRSGGEFLGLAVAPGRSLVISEEPRDLWPQRAHRHRLGNEVGVLTRPFAGRPSPADFERLAAEIVELKQQQGLDLVVFDSLAAFLPARQENSADVMVGATAPFIALAEVGLAVLLLHHPSKGEPALGQAARGSGALLAAVDIFLEMRYPAGNPFTRRRRLFGWSRYEETPQQMLIELSADGLHYERLADAGDDFHDHWNAVQFVLADAEPRTLQQIRAEWPPDQRRPHHTTLWRWLDRAVELGLACRTGTGTKSDPYCYELSPAAREGT
jgi:AAA domain